MSQAFLDFSLLEKVKRNYFVLFVPLSPFRSNVSPFCPQNMVMTKNYQKNKIVNFVHCGYCYLCWASWERDQNKLRQCSRLEQKLKWGLG